MFCYDQSLKFWWSGPSKCLLSGLLVLPSCVPCDVKTVGARREAAVKDWPGLALLVVGNGVDTAFEAVDNGVATVFEVVDNGVFAAALEFVDNRVPVAVQVVDNGVSAALDSEVDDNRVAAALEVTGWLDVGVHINTYIHGLFKSRL